LGASYTYNALRVMGGYLDVNDKRTVGPDGKGFDGHGWWLGTDYRIGLNLLKFQFLQNKGDYGVDNKTNAYGIGYQYDLSKRTSLYTSLMRFDNGTGAGSSTGVNGAGRFNMSIPSGLTIAGDNDITEFMFGVCHNF